MKNTKRKLAYGGLTKGLQLGASAVNMIDGMDGTPTREASALSGIMSGASMGSAFGPVGMGVGALAGGAMSIIAANAAEKKEREAQDLYRKNVTEQHKLQSQQVLKNYATQGVNSMGSYANGGNIPETYEVEQDEVVQGNAILESAKPIASDLQTVTGGTHAEGGVQGVGGERVFSDRLKSTNGKTFAINADKLGKQKGKFEKKLYSTNSASRFTGERMTTRIDSQLDELFNEQEMKKLANPSSLSSSKQKFPRGGTLPKLTSLSPELWKQDNTAPNGVGIVQPIDLASIQANIAANTKAYLDSKKLNLGEGLGYTGQYIDNFANALATANTPSIPKPYLDPNIKLNTEFDIRPQLQSARTEREAVSRSIDANTASSGTANANKQNLLASSLNNSNALYSQKNNIENQLKNQEVMANANITSRNNQQLYNNDMQNAQRRAGIAFDYAQNAGNLSTDLYTAARDTKMDNRDIESVKMIMLANPNSAQYGQQLNIVKQRYMNDPVGLQSAIDSIRASAPNSPALKDLEAYKAQMGK